MQLGSAHPLALIAALPRELSPLARSLGATGASSAVRNRDGILLATATFQDGRGGSWPVLLVSAGMGPGRVALAVEAALAHGPVSGLLSVGVAGACDPRLTSGACLAVSLVIDTSSGERYPTDVRFHDGPAGVLVTARTIAGVAEKVRLRGAYCADLVDMEAATVARLARAYGLPFGAVKAVSDDHTLDLAHLSAFSDARGQFRTVAFARHTVLHPKQWRTAISLGRGNKVALTSLTAALRQLLARLIMEAT